MHRGVRRPELVSATNSREWFVRGAEVCIGYRPAFSVGAFDDPVAGDCDDRSFQGLDDLARRSPSGPEDTYPTVSVGANVFVGLIEDRGCD